MNIQKFIILSLAVLLCFVGFSQDTAVVTQFGYQVNSRENAVPFVNKAIAECKRTGKSVLVFPKGRYDCWPH